MCEKSIEEIKSFVPIECISENRRRKEKYIEKTKYFLENNYFDSNSYLPAPMIPIFTKLLGTSSNHKRNSSNSSTSFSFGTKSTEDLSESPVSPHKGMLSLGISLKKCLSSRSVPSSPKISPRNSGNFLNSMNPYLRLSNKSLSSNDSLFEIPLNIVKPSPRASPNERKEFFSRFRIPSRSELKIPRKSLGITEILQNNDSKSKFMEFARKEYSEENLEFWDEVKEFKNIDDLEERMNKAEMMFNLYLTSEAQAEINIPAKLCKLKFEFDVVIFFFFYSKKS